MRFFWKKIVCVPKNSLYIAFTNGFHKRTPFNNLSERSLVFLQYVQRFNKFDYLDSIGMELINDYERHLTNYALNKLKKVEGLKIHGSSSERSGINSRMSSNPL